MMAAPLASPVLQPMRHGRALLVRRVGVMFPVRGGVRLNDGRAWK